MTWLHELAIDVAWIAARFLGAAVVLAVVFR